MELEHQAGGEREMRNQSQHRGVVLYSSADVDRSIYLFQLSRNLEFAKYIDLTIIGLIEPSALIRLSGNYEKKENEMKVKDARYAKLFPLHEQRYVGCEIL